MSQRFIPHRKSGYCPLPLQDEPTYLAASIGIKITTGLQILLTEAKSKSRMPDEISDTPEYKKFLNRLSENDYFDGEIEHSKKWTELEHKAKTFFMDSYESDSNESHRKACSKGKFYLMFHFSIFIVMFSDTTALRKN